MIEIININKESFLELKGAERLFEMRESTNYCLIKDSKVQFGIGWNKEYAEPVFLNLEEFELLVIGIYDYVYAVSLTDGALKFAMGLYDELIAIEKVELGFLIVSETTLTRINGSNCTLGSFNLVPDIVLDYQISAKKISVNCVTGTLVHFNI